MRQTGKNELGMRSSTAMEAPGCQKGCQASPQSHTWAGGAFGRFGMESKTHSQWMPGLQRLS